MTTESFEVLKAFAARAGIAILFPNQKDPKSTYFVSPEGKMKVSKR